MAELFTRGAVGAPDKRGDALMQRHADKMQRAKEEAALKAMRRLLPDMSPGVWVLALQECDWDVENATILLNTFKAVKADELQLIQKALDALSQPQGDKEAKKGNMEHGKRKRSHKDGAERKDKKKHKNKHEKRSKDRRRGDREEDENPPTMKDAFGKYGIIGEADISSKYTEFALWALEAMKMDIELLPKTEEKELFRTFCEDYNTATLPHKKYYNLQQYERDMAEGAAKRGLSEDEEPMVLNDEEDLKRQQAAERARERQERLRDAYLELKHSAPGKAEDMRQQDLLRSQMALAYKTGDRETVAQIAERLKPDEVKEREAAKRVDPDNPMVP